MGKIAALFSLFRKGNEIADPEKWKSHQVTTNNVAVFLAALLAVAKAFGMPIPVGDGDLVLVAGGMLGAVNVVLTIVTSKRAGLPDVSPHVVTAPGSGSAAPAASQVELVQPADPGYNAERGY